jgi:hypothetical protein
MQPYIFLSWGSPDARAVIDLRDQLQRAGYRLSEYMQEPIFGDTIQHGVAQRIHDAEAAIFCFSDETAERPWIEDELKMAYGAFGGDITRMLPVWVGAHPHDRCPSVVTKYSLGVLDLYGNREISLVSLKRKVAELLKAPSPIVIPAALMAMNARQCQALIAALQADVQQGMDIRALCNSFGMRDLLEDWPERYRETREEFAPYNDTALTALVADAVAAANTERVKSGKRPFAIRWVHHELGRGTEESQRIRNWWRETRPLLVIDSISTLLPEIEREILRLPDFTNASILWIPPYTRHTAGTEEALRKSVTVIPSLGDTFSLWERSAARPGAVDCGTRLSARLWMQRVFFDLTSPEDEPVSGNRDSVAEELPAMGSVSAMLNQ